MTKKGDGHTKKPKRKKSRRKFMYWRGRYMRDKIFKESKHLKKIKEWFLDPFLSICPDQCEPHHWLAEHFFHIDTRTIKQYCVFRPFTMPGSLYIAGSKLDYTGGYRKVKRGTQLYVRHDTTMPDRYDVEIVPKIGVDSQVFRLDELDWIRIKHHCQLMDIE